MRVGVRSSGEEGGRGWVWLITHGILFYIRRPSRGLAALWRLDEDLSRAYTEQRTTVMASATLHMGETPAWWE